jgi:hypothetical protein
MVCNANSGFPIEIVQKKGKKMSRNRRKKYEAGLQKSDAKDIEMPAQAGGSKLYEENGRVFCAKPGMPIECRRDGDDTQPKVSPPNHARHNYPSA